MPLSIVRAVTLIRHPESRNGAVRGIHVRVCREPGGTLAITYSIEDDLAHVRVPPLRAPRIAHGLWLQTCCECFVAFKDAPGYHEFNFSPSGEWAAYAFRKDREGEALVDETLNPKIAVRKNDKKLELDASIPLERLSVMHPRSKLLLALSTVIEDEGGVLSYWAIRHPAGKPDFHHPDCFVLEV